MNFSRTLFPFAGSKLVPDFFLDVEGFDPHAMLDSQKKETQASSQETPSEGDVAKTFEVLASTCSKELVDSVKGVIEFHLEGTEPGVWYLDLKNESGDEYFITRYFSHIYFYITFFTFRLFRRMVSNHRNPSLFAFRYLLLT